MPNQLACHGVAMTVGKACTTKTGVCAKQLTKLYSLLHKLHPSRRQEVIRCHFTQQQRLVLERWMLEKLKGGRGEQEVNFPRAAAPACAKKLRKRCRSSGCSTFEPEKQNRDRQEARGITTQRRLGQALYSAVVHVERLEIRTRLVKSKSLAVKFRKILLDVKDEVVASLESQRTGPEYSGSLEDLALDLTTKINLVLSRHGVSEVNLGLFFRVTTPAKQWIGTTLSGPVFHLRTLEVGLRGWCMMQRARGAGTPECQQELDETWVRACQAHLNIWELAGRSRAAVAKRLRALEHRRSAEREKLLQHWQCRDLRRAARQEAQTRALAQAARCSMERVEARIRQILSTWAERVELRSK